MLVVANGGVYPSGQCDFTVNEALLRFFRHARASYRNPDGSESRCVESLKAALGCLRKFFGPTRLADFAPPHLKAVRQTMIDEGRERTNINRFVGLIRQFFKWCVEEQLIPEAVYETLLAVSPPTPGQSGAAGSEPAARNRVNMDHERQGRRTRRRAPPPRALSKAEVMHATCFARDAEAWHVQ